MYGWRIFVGTQQSGTLKAFLSSTVNVRTRGILTDSTSCPVGYVDPEKGKGNGKIPIGIMAMGEWGSEDALLAWGQDVERWLNEESAGGRQRPANWVDIIEQSKTKM
jgi:Asp-tRNA(Asn)/Glu-tRNA(Gln) amidotransferase A subunit family amidase